MSMGTEKQGSGLELDSGVLGGCIECASDAIEVKKRVREKKSTVGFRLTDRDYDIFGFLLDQKFASLEALYFRFFDARQSPTAELPDHLRVARQRLGILKRAGLVTDERVYSDPKSLMLLTEAGHHVFKMRRDEDAYALPVASVDFRNYEHDQAVNYCRVAIERMGKSMRWYSERRLRMQGFKVPGVDVRLPKGIVPDAIFISSKGERVAFELEYTHRKKSRYQAKVSEYQSVMGGSQPLIHRVLFVGGNERVYRDLKEVLPAGSTAFWLESYAHFLGRLFPPSHVLKVHRMLQPKGDRVGQVGGQVQESGSGNG